MKIITKTNFQTMLMLLCLFTFQISVIHAASVDFQGNSSGNSSGQINATPPSSGSTSCGTGGFTNFKCAVSTLISWINLLIPLLFGVAVLLFIFGLFKYLTAGGDTKQIAEARNFIIFGIIALSVMVAVWGIVNVVVSSFFPSGGLSIPQIKSS